MCCWTGSLSSAKKKEKKNFTEILQNDHEILFIASVMTSASAAANVATPSEIAVLHALLVTKDALLAKKEEEAQHMKKAYENLLIAYERLRRQLFGQKAERLSPEQQAFAWEAAMKEVAAQGSEAELPKPPPPPTRSEPKPRKAAPHGRRNIAEIDLPEETIELLPAHLPEGATRIGQDTTYRIEHQRARLVKVKLVRPIFKFLSERTQETEPMEATLVQADTPHEMIPKGILGPALLAHVFVSKWVDHLPFHRQERIFARQNVPIDRATMCRSAEQCAALAKCVVDACWQDARAHAHVFATDATGVLVQHPEACRRGHFFVAIADSDYVFFTRSTMDPKQSSDSIALLGCNPTHKCLLRRDEETLFVRRRESLFLCSRSLL